MNRVIGILAHVDAGKTTLAEQILYHTKAIRTRGRVDHQDAFLDNHPIEKERGITVFSDQAVFESCGNRYFLLDTPGHVDFSAEMERSIQAMDYAIIVISGLDGIQGHTQTVWTLLKRAEIPVLFFINKLDREEANFQKIVDQLKETFSSGVVWAKDHFNEGKPDEFLAEEIASLDDELLEYYLEKGYFEPYWNKRITELIQNRKLFLCFGGSALMDLGIDQLICGLNLFTGTDDHVDEPFSAQIYKIRHDRQRKKWIYLKVNSGILSVKDEIAYYNRDTLQIEKGKINEIRYYNGDKATAVSSVRAGELCAVSGLSEVCCGDRIGAQTGGIEYEMVPMLRVSVEYDHERVSPKQVLECFQILEAEDPMLSVSWDELLQQVQVNIMGTIQLEVLKEIVWERFSLAIEFGSCRILYQETILSPVIGYGHFEPLKHYAEVHLRIEPAERGAGILFESACSTDVLAQNFQNLIRTHIFEKEHKGVLLGMPLTDVKITLLTGRAHEKHTEGGDFREATYRALRQGLLQAESAVLEPYYSFVMEADNSDVGRMMSDIQKRNGSFDSPETVGQKVRLCGRVPVAEMLNYYQEFISYTRGKGCLSLMFDRYELCHNQREVQELFSYDPQSDLENTGDSVFCSHGSGFLVSWKEAKQYMHCKE